MGAASQALLCAVCLLCALRARQGPAGAGPGFLLQALGAASAALEPPGGTEGPGPPDPLPGPWVSALLGQPLVAFGYHRLSGDRATGNLLLAVASGLAAVAAWLPEEERLLAARAVTFLTAASLLTLAGLTGNGPAALGGLLVAAGYLWPGAGSRRGGPAWGGPAWVLAAGNLALQRGLRAAGEQ